MDKFPRPTATRDRLLPWLNELSHNAAGLVDAFRPGHPGIRPGAREQIVLAVTEMNGCRYTAWIHGAWSEFLGEDQVQEAMPLLLDFARESAMAGAPVDTASLEASLPDEAVRAVRATVAVAEVSSLVGNTADGLWERLMLRRPLDPVATARELLTVVMVAPLAAPLFLAAGAMRLASLVAPPLPNLVRPSDSEANLVVHMLADAVPQYLSNAMVRAAVLRLPGPMVIGVRAEQQEATIRINRDQIEISNGLASDAAIVMDGGVEWLLEAATRNVNRELTRLTSRRG